MIVNHVDAACPGTETFGRLHAQRVKQLAGHHVVAELVDPADDLQKRRRLPHQNRFEFLAYGPASPPARMDSANFAPERREHAIGVRVVPQRGARKGVGRAGGREIARKKNPVRCLAADVHCNPRLVPAAAAAHQVQSVNDFQVVEGRIGGYENTVAVRVDTELVADGLVVDQQRIRQDML